MMKKLIILFLALFLFVGSTACTSSETAVEDVSADATQSTHLTADYNDALSIIAQLAVGTLQLEETELAVDETLAAEILPLWQAAQSLSNSETAASAEVEAVLNQIQDAMSPDQVTAIADMSLTSDSLTELMESGAITFGPGRGQGQGQDSGADADTGFNPQAGGGPGGGAGGFGGPGGGGLAGATGGETLNEDDIATRQAERANGEGLDGLQDQLMVNAVIRLLQTKSGDEPELPQNGPQAGVNEAVFTAVSNTLGLTFEDLQAEIAESDSLVAVIEAHGGDVTAVREAIITSLNELPNAAELDIEQIATNWLSE